MDFSFSRPDFSASSPAEKKAAEIFTQEISARIDISTVSTCDITVIFNENASFPSEDGYEITVGNNSITFTASGIRGLIYAVGRFLRKITVKNNRIYIPDDISGRFIPCKSIRGHQLGYRDTSNTYEAWDIPEYKKYYLELMYFGTNTVEHIPYENGSSYRIPIMKRDEQELLCLAAEEADKLGLKVSVWYPNCEKDADTALKNREKLFSEASRLDYIFPPGGDPGSLLPDELMERCRLFREILKKYHPDAEMWPSAQQPHQYPDWGIRFLKETEKLPDFIDGVITGPNAAFPLDDLRRRLPGKYPIRFYPDITHNLRCEYPVHFDRDDWHYALQVVNGRESANPRPSEYKKIHELTRPYVIGSVSYSEGVNDDINKAVWSALDFDPDTPLREILTDYSRLFFPGSDPEKVADAIFVLEKNWEGAPEDNPSIEYTLRLWQEIGEEAPALYGNWRFVQCLFRAKCDCFVRRKILFENALIKKAKRATEAGDMKEAEKILMTPADKNISELRKAIENDADVLFSLIGLQLSTKKHFAKNFERGAILDTIDFAITDLPWLLSRFEIANTLPEEKREQYILRCFNRNKVECDEYYYSVALHGLDPGGVTQEKFFYMNIQGDRPEKNNGTLPTSLFKLYDHIHFRLKTGGLYSKDGYILQITYRDLNNEDSIKHSVRINGNTVYCGQQFGGSRNYDYERDMLPDGFIAVEYKIPAEYIINGCISLEISEPVNGFEIAELRITKSSYKS